MVPSFALVSNTCASIASANLCVVVFSRYTVPKTRTAVVAGASRAPRVKVGCKAMGWRRGEGVVAHVDNTFVVVRPWDVWTEYNRNGRQDDLSAHKTLSLPSGRFPRVLSPQCGRGGAYLLL